MATTTTEPDKTAKTTTDSTPTIGDGDQQVKIGIDPQALIDAARAASDAEKKTNKKNNAADDDTTIRAIPALVATTGSATTTAALAAGSTLGPIGLGAVAAGAAVITVGMLVRNHTRANDRNRNGNGRGNNSTGGNARGAAGNTGSLLGSGGGSARRNGRGGSGLGTGSSGSSGGGRRRSGSSVLHNSGTAGTGSKTRKNKSTSGLSGNGTGRHGALKKTKHNSGLGGSHSNKSHGTGKGKGKGDKKPRSYSSTAVPVGAKAQRGAALLAARKNAGGKGALGTGHGSKGTTRAALKKASGKALKATGRTLMKTPVGKVAKATGRGINKVMGKPARAVWNSRPVQTVRSAARRLGRATRKSLVVRPVRATARALSRLWRRIRPGVGTYAHAVRTGLIGAWSLTCGLLSLLLLFGWKKVKGADGEFDDLLAGRITRRVWERLMKRSRARRDATHRAHGLTMTVDDPGNDAKADDKKRWRKKSKEEEAAQAPLIEYLEIDTLPDMDRIAAEYRGIGDGIRSVRTTITIIFNATDRHYPLPKSFRLEVEGLVGALDAAAAYADSMWVQFARVHAQDLARYDDPRANERLWNVVPDRTRTDGGGVQSRPSNFAVACARMPEVYSEWAPTSPADPVSAFAGVGASIHTIAAAIKRLRDDANESQPVHRSIPDMLNTLAQNLASCASNAERLATVLQAIVDAEVRKMAAASADAATAKK